MHLVCLIFLTTIRAILVKSQFWEDIINNDGWIPITREKVYNNRHEKLLPITERIETYENRKELISDMEFAIDVERLENSLQNNGMIASDSLSKIIPYDINHRKDNNYNKDEVIDIMSGLQARKLRKAKIIAGDVSSKSKGSAAQLDAKIRDHAEEETSKHELQYQVFENQEQNEKPVTNSDNRLLEEPSLYQYDVVNDTMKFISRTGTNEFTKKLSGILSSYNFRVNDVLPDYELSRQSFSSHNPATNEFVLVPIPIRLSNRYNILNQVQLDSLLAVILSNYGYYLPSQYGLINKYKNLYAHLASNNIHNNKPFGSYKVFADTDSSN